MGLYGDHRSTSRYHTDVTRALYGEDLPQLKTTHMKLGNRTLESFSLVALASLVLLATSCSKDEETATPVTPTPTGNTNSTANTTPVLTGADGALWAVSTATNYTFPFLGTIQIDVNTGVAVFWDDAGAAIQAGTVKCNDSTLTFTNNAYAFQPTGGNVNGIEFSGGVNWNVTGGNGIPTFTRNTNAISFPIVDTVSSAGTIDRAVDYTLTVASVYGADSVYFAIGGILKRQGANDNTCTFTAAELGTLNAGTSVAQVVAFNYYPENIGGKDIYFGKERVVTKLVTLQ